FKVNLLLHGLSIRLDSSIVNLKVSARMEEAEVPLEHLQEHVHHSAEHGGVAWISWVALSTALLAVLAAIAGLLSGKHANEAMMNQIEASDQWSYYQAKSIKAAVLDAKIALSGMPSEQDRKKNAKYQEEESEINRKPSTRKPQPNQTFTSTKCSRAA